MKKNLRIVSAAAAALLAVAPVAATVAPAASVKAVTVASGSTYTTTDPTKVPAMSAAQILKEISAIKNPSVWKVTKPEVKTVTNTGKDTVDQTLTFTLTYTGNKPNHVSKDALLAIAKAIKPDLSSTAQASEFSLNNKGQIVRTVNNTPYVLDEGTAVVKGAKVVKATKPADTSADHITTDGLEIGNSIFAENQNTTVTINAVAKYGVTGAQAGFASSINGQIVYTDAKGVSHTALLHGKNNTTVMNAITKKPVTELRAGVPYIATFNNVTVNLGNDAKNSTVKFVLPRNAKFNNPDSKNKANVKTVNVDANGIADLGKIYAGFYAYDPSDLQEVHFFSQKSGNIVTSGSVDLHAVNGRLNLYSFWHAMNQEYVASQLLGSTGSIENQNGNSYPRMLPVVPQNDLKAQLEKQNIKVDDNGYFTAPASFTVNMNAKSIYNGATATLPVTVNVDNVTPAASQETTKTVKIMHIATIYDKNGKATHEPALRAYNTVSVVSEPVSLKDEKGKDAGKFYKLAGKDQYIKVGNVDGTSRSLKHNSYVYKSTGKRRGKTVLKKGSSVTTYGKSFMIAGHQMYRIGENQYVKKANF